MLVFPGGAKVTDGSGVLEGDYKDGRRTAILKDINDVTSKEDALRNIIKEWIRLIDK